MIVTDVAKYFIHLSHKVNAPISQLKLQKLLYYAQGWSFVWDDKALFDEHIEAWRYGPVIPKIYHEYKEYGNGPIPETEGLSFFPFAGDYELKTIEAVWDGYKKYSPIQLVNKTHREDPWRDAIEEYKKSYDDVIYQDSIKAYFIRVYKN